MKNKCISCESENVEIAVIRKQLSYVVCGDCDHCEKVRYSADNDEEFEAAQEKYYGKDSHFLQVGSSPFEDEQLDRRIRTVSRHLPTGRTVVEVGPGTGRFLDWLSKNGFQVTAIEHSVEIANFLTETMPVNVITGEFDSVDLDGIQADAFCSFHVIEHVSSPEKHLSRAYQITRSGGVAFIATPNAGSWEQQIPGHLSPNFDSAHLRVFSTSSLIRLAKSAGWTVVEVKTPEYTNGWLRVGTKLLRRLRNEDEESSAGKYSGNAGGYWAGISAALKAVTFPLRFAQEKLSGGNEIFLVLKK